MATPEIVIRGMDHEQTLAVPGTYDGVTLGWEFMRIGDTFRAMTSGALDVCEFSLANYLILRGTGNDWLTAIPVFPYRAFRHSLAVTRKDSTLVDLRDLAGKRVGVEDYSMTAAVWFRALLREEYGVDHRSISWVAHAGSQRFPWPAGARVEKTDEDLEALLRDGAIDALLGVSPRDARLPAAERRFRTVLADPQAEERAYYERTGLYPIHHVIVVRNAAMERIPNLVDVLWKAYAGAKARAYERRLGATLVPWSGAHWTRTFDLFGGDPLPYGWTPENRAMVERLAANLKEQGFIAAVPDVDRLFAKPSTRP